MGQTDLRYLKSLSNQYPTIATAATEIINYRRFLACQKQQNILSQMCTGSTTSFYMC